MCALFVHLPVMSIPSSISAHCLLSTISPLVSQSGSKSVRPSGCLCSHFKVCHSGSVTICQMAKIENNFHTDYSYATVCQTQAQANAHTHTHIFTPCSYVHTKYLWANRICVPVSKMFRVCLHMFRVLRVTHKRSHIHTHKRLH